MKTFRVSYNVTSFVNVYVEANDEDEALELANEEVKNSCYNNDILENCRLEEGEVDEM